ncbi:MAG: glutamate 5-kinase [Dehalococcoidia bacterium]|jgi:glutamate 5-kinase|nr:glutamate 5-kinase [Dehalococcoidia bacterium]
MSAQGSKSARVQDRRNRLVVKLGTNLLTGGRETLDIEIMTDLVAQMAALVEAGHDVLLVTSGAVAGGRRVVARRPGTGQPGSGDVPGRQVLAALGMPELMRTYDELFARHGIAVAQALISRPDIANRQRYLNVRNTLESVLNIGAVPIINENDVVTVEELEGDVFGDNDRLSASIANAVNADGLLLLGHEEGLFTADPNIDASATRIESVMSIDRTIEAMAGDSRDGRGQGGMRSKVEAARMATRFGAYTVIAAGRTPDVIPRIADGERIGTRFEPTTDRVEGWKRFLLTGTASSRGGVAIDAGATKAVRYGGNSLLPAGIVRVDGSFERGDNISILDPANDVVAWGISNYRSVEIERIMGVRSDRIETILGLDYGPDVVHRNNMALAEDGLDPEPLENTGDTAPAERATGR